MSDRISLRTLLVSIAAIAVLMMLLRLAIIQSDGTALRVLLCILAVPLFTFALFALFYAVTLPFGVLTQITRESLAS